MKTHSLQVIENANILINDTIIKGTIIIDNEKIIEIHTTNHKTKKYQHIYTNVHDAKGHLIIPGLVDIHCHGGNDSSFMDCTFFDYKNALQFFLKQGTTSIFPTSLSCDDKLLAEFLNTYSNYLHNEKDVSIKSMLKGIHLEGPYLSTENSGAQPKEHCKQPIIHDVQEILEQYPFIKRWTIAPEVDVNFSLAHYLTEHNILVSAGHTNALYNDMLLAFNNGYSHMTHLYSGMNSLVYVNGLRKAGAVEAALLTKDVTVEIIADGIHLPYPFIELVYKLKGADNIAIITDAMRGTGTKDIKSVLGNRHTGTHVILEDGVAKLLDHTSLAGSITTLIEMVRKLTKYTNIPFSDIIKMCTYTPARIMNIHNEVGLIQVDYRADLLELDEELNIINVIKNGLFL